LQDRPLGLLNRRGESAAVEPKQGNHGGMTDTLVAVDEGVVLDEREPEGCGLRRETRIEVFAAESLAWLRDGRLQGTQVAKEGLLATLFHYQPVEKQYLSQAEVLHYLRRS
jgi:hypothetical protein